MIDSPAFYLIEKAGEIRYTKRVSATRIGNEIRHGWRVITRWKEKPSSLTVATAVVNLKGI